MIKKTQLQQAAGTRGQQRSVSPPLQAAQDKFRPPATEFIFRQQNGIRIVAFAGAVLPRRQKAGNGPIRSPEPLRTAHPHQPLQKIEVVKEQKVERQGIYLTNFVMEKIVRFK